MGLLAIGACMVLASAWSLGAVDSGQLSPETTIWFAAPAKDFTESLPLGNGRLGAMMFGGVDEERIVLNERLCLVRFAPGGRPSGCLAVAAGDSPAAVGGEESRGRGARECALYLQGPWLQRSPIWLLSGAREFASSI